MGTLALLVLLKSAAQDLALPVGLMDGPTLHRPAVRADDVRPAAAIDIALTLLLRRRQFAGDAPVVAAPAMDVIVVEDRDDARLGQVEQPPGDDLVAGGAIALFQFEHVPAGGRRVGGEPAGRHEQAISEEVGQRFAGHGARLVRHKAEAAEQLTLEVFADLVRHGPLMTFFGRLGPQEDLFAAGRPLRSAALRLRPIETDEQSQVPLGQNDGVDGRFLHAGAVEQFQHDAIDGFDNFFPGEVLAHACKIGSERQRHQGQPVRVYLPIGRTRSGSFPVDWKLNLQKPLQGTVIFLRRTNNQGVADLLAQSFSVDPLWPNRLIRAEVDLTRGEIRFYRLRRREPNEQPLIKTIPYQTPTQRFQE